MSSTPRQITAAAHAEADIPASQAFSYDVEEELEHSPWVDPEEKKKQKQKAQSQAGSQVSRRSRVSKGSKTQDPLPSSSIPRIPSAASYKSAILACNEPMPALLSISIQPRHDHLLLGR